MLRLLPCRLALFPPLHRPPPVQRHPERNPHQPTAKPRRIPEPLEIPVRLQQRFLRYIFRVGRMPQNSIRYAKRQRPALRQPLFKLAVSAGTFFPPLLSPREQSSRLDQDQLPHSQSPLHQTRRRHRQFGSIPFRRTTSGLTMARLFEPLLRMSIDARPFPVWEVTLASPFNSERVQAFQDTAALAFFHLSFLLASSKPFV